MGFAGSIGRGLLGLGTAGVSEGVMAGADLARGKDIGTTGGDMSGAIDKGVGGAVDDFSNVGHTYFTPTPYTGALVPQYGDDPNGAVNDQNYGRGLAGTYMDQSGRLLGNANDAYGAMMGGPGQFSQNQGQMNQEAGARGYDQMGALQLQREAAMGQSPSAAAYQMQQGLDQSLANQQAMAGGARGAAGLALAGSNAMSNSANLQNNAFTNASALRAQEMQGARSGYGDLASNVRAQDQGIIGLSDQVGNNNANNVNGYRLGVGGVGASYAGAGMAGGQVVNGMYGNSQNAPTSQLNSRTSVYGTNAGSYNNAQNNMTNIATGDAAAKAGQTNKLYDMAGQLVGGLTKSGSGIGGTKPS